MRMICFVQFSTAPDLFQPTNNGRGVGESGTHSRMGHIRFLRFVGIRVVVRPQYKSTEYYFHHRPSFAVEISIIYVTTFIKLKKCILGGSSKLFFFFHPFHSIPFSGFLLEIGVHLFKMHHKEAPSINPP